MYKFINPFLSPLTRKMEEKTAPQTTKPFEKGYKLPSHERQVVVTGGAGYLGSVLVPMLLEEGYQVHVIDRFYFGRESLASVANHPRLKLTDMDIFYHENIPNLFKGVYSVIHLASISNDPSGDLDPNLTIQTNFLSTLSLARRAKTEGVRRFIFISSCSVYGASGDTYLDEKSQTGPVTLYALSKLQCENELIPMTNKKFSATMLRFATLFGYSPKMRFDLAVNVMAKRALQGQSLTIHGDGTQYRPFLHVKDASRSILQVLRSDPQAMNRKICNVGSEGLNFMIKDLAHQIHAFFPGSKLEQVPFSNDNRSYRVKFDYFEKLCQFQTKYVIEDGLKEISEAYRQGLLTNMDDEKYYNVEVMKKQIKGPTLTYSLASTPRWS